MAKLGPSAIVQAVKDEFYKQYPDNPDLSFFNYALDVEPTTLIVKIGREKIYYRIPYSIDKDANVEFGPRNEWTEVEEKRIWVVKIAELRLAKGTMLAVDMNWFQDLQNEFEFTIDLAASEKYRVTQKYFSTENSAFDHDWEGVCWLSPPWTESELPKWVAKAEEQTRNGNAETIVMLLPVRENSSWWKTIQSVAHEIRPIVAKFRRMSDDSTWAIQVEPHVLVIFKTKSIGAIKFDIDAPCKHKEVKVLDDESRRIGMYATVWGELDCDNERMTQAAIEPYVGKGSVPLMLWMHGLDKEFGANVPGVWDVDSFVMDDVGLYVEGNIGFGYYGNKAWDRIQSAGSYGGSLGSIWYLVDRAKSSDGSVDITDWPLLEISVMEGGKQCVPSAMRQLADKGLEDALLNLATKMGVEFEAEEVSLALTEGQRTLLQTIISLS